MRCSEESEFSHICFEDNVMSSRSIYNFCDKHINMGKELLSLGAGDLNFIEDTKMVIALSVMCQA